MAKKWNTNIDEAPRDRIIEVNGHVDISTRQKRTTKAQWNKDFELWATVRGDVIFPDKWREL